MTHSPRDGAQDNPFDVSEAARTVVTYSGDAFTMYSHTGTHIDSLNHFGLHGEIWNGFDAERHLDEEGWKVNGADKIPPIIANAVLIDLLKASDRTQLPPNHRISAEEIRHALNAQNIKIRPGDVVLLRTGQGAYFSDPERYGKDAAGLSVEAAMFLADEGAMIVGMDVMNPEILPSGLEDNWIPVHTFLLGEKGIPIIENLDLEALASDRLYRFAFIGMPLKIRGATGSPIRPIALPLEQSDQLEVAAK
nr:cyclase family protein [Agrobacterium pusense]